MKLTLKTMNAGNGQKVPYVQRIEFNGTTIIGTSIRQSFFSPDELTKIKEQAKHRESLH